MEQFSYSSMQLRNLSLQNRLTTSLDYANIHPATQWIVVNAPFWVLRSITDLFDTTETDRANYRAATILDTIFDMPSPDIGLRLKQYIKAYESIEVSWFTRHPCIKKRYISALCKVGSDLSHGECVKCIFANQSCC